MKTIGFIDYYLDEWHANNYPAWIRARRAAIWKWPMPTAISTTRRAA